MISSEKQNVPEERQLAFVVAKSRRILVLGDVRSPIPVFLQLPYPEP